MRFDMESDLFFTIAMSRLPVMIKYILSRHGRELTFLCHYTYIIITLKSVRSFRRMVSSIPSILYANRDNFKTKKFHYTAIYLTACYVIYTCRISADNCRNRSNYDTSNRFGTNTLWRPLFKKKTRATQIFNMAAIFQDGRHRVSWNVIFCLKNGGKWSKKIIVTTEFMLWACEMYI